MDMLRLDEVWDHETVTRLEAGYLSEVNQRIKYDVDLLKRELRATIAATHVSKM